MTNTTLTGKRPRPFLLVAYSHAGQELMRTQFSSAERLARAAYRESQHRRWLWRWNECIPLSRVARHEAFSPRGKPLEFAELVIWGRRLGYGSGRGTYVYRAGPVEGIRKWRGGGSRSNVRIIGEYRGTALVCAEDGEVAARPCRRGSNIHPGWDGWPRCVQRSWKTQRRGRKSWDRV